MLSRSRIFELAFVAPQTKTKRPPELLFRIINTRLAPVWDCLTELRVGSMSYAEQYCGRTVHFELPGEHLFNAEEFGFGGCGYVIKRDLETEFRFPLSIEKIRETTLSINLLVTAFYQTSTYEPLANHTQQIDLMLSVELPSARGYEHAMSVWIDVATAAWLRNFAKSKQGSANAKGEIELPREVFHAMKQTWKAVAPDAVRKYEYGGYVCENGRLILGCFDRCVLYIDSSELLDHLDVVESIQLTCGNLDHAHQQLTFLAALASLCELARSQ